MSIVTILSGSYTRGKEVAAKGGAVYLKRRLYPYEQLIGKITQTTRGVPEVKSINIDVVSHLALED